MTESFTPRAKRIIERARQFSEANEHTYIGPEHILRGVLDEKDGIIPGVIQRAGFDPQELRDKISMAVKDAWLVKGNSPDISLSGLPDVKAIAGALRSLADQLEGP